MEFLGAVYICLLSSGHVVLLPVVMPKNPSFKTRGLRELRTLVRLVLTGPSDKGGG